MYNDPSVFEIEQKYVTAHQSYTVTILKTKSSKLYSQCLAKKMSFFAHFFSEVLEKTKLTRPALDDYSVNN